MTKRALFALCFIAIATQAEAQCTGGICGPSNSLTWVQPDGTVATTGWQVLYSKNSGVCSASTGVTVTNLTLAQLNLPAGTPTPVTAIAGMNLLTLTNGRWYVNIRAMGPGGESPCSTEINFPFAATPPAAPTGFGVR